MMSFFGGCCGAKEAENLNRQVWLDVKETGEGDKKKTEWTLKADEAKFINNEANKDEVIVRVHFVAVQMDALNVSPAKDKNSFAIGRFFSGKVHWASQTQEDFKKDDLVYGWTDSGAFQSWVKVPLKQVAKWNDHDSRQVGAVGPYLAWLAEEASKVPKDSTIVVHSSNKAVCSTVDSFKVVGVKVLDAKSAWADKTKTDKWPHYLKTNSKVEEWDVKTTTENNVEKKETVNTAKWTHAHIKSEFDSFKKSYEAKVQKTEMKDNKEVPVTKKVQKDGKEVDEPVMVSANQDKWQKVKVCVVGDKDKLLNLFKSAKEGNKEGNDLVVLDAHLLNDLSKWEKPAPAKAQ